MTLTPDERHRQITGLLSAGQLDEALAASDAAIAAAPQIAGFHILKAASLLALKRYEDAARAIGPLFAVPQPLPGIAYALRAQALWGTGRHDEAIDTLKTGVAVHPADHRMRELLGGYGLATGDFELGWREAESRLARLPIIRPDVPRWAGEALTGKRLLVMSEQGLGDTLQFARFIPALRQRGATVTAVVQPAVAGLLRTLDPEIVWSSDIAAPGDFDYRIDLLSLPLLLGIRLETIPAETPYLAADPDKVAAWREHLGLDGFKVGIAWQGSVGPRADRDRTVPIEFFAQLAAPGIRLISLQGVHGLDALANLPAEMVVERLGEKIEANPDGISEIAAVMQNLDLIICSDTMTAHVAGALGQPVWVALKRDAEWRWLRGRSDSPWYPTMRLFRQETAGDWTPVFSAMAAQLNETRK